MSIWKLWKETHFIMDRWKKEEISHHELLWHIPQVIRLQNTHYNRAYREIIWWKEISLINHENPINDELIQSFKPGDYTTDWAMICRIIPPEEFLRNDIDMSDTSKPLLDAHSLQEVRVIEMENKPIEKLTNSEIEKSLACLWADAWIEKFLQWLSIDFYKNTKTVEQLIATRKVFYRLISLPNEQ